MDEVAYRVLFEANPHPMWVFDRSSLRFLAVNDAALRQYGYSREEFLGRTILDIRPEDDASLVPGSVEEGPSTPRIWRHRRKDGSTLLAEISAQSLSFGGIDARLVLAIDVTLRERQAELLRQSNRTLEAVLQTAPVGIVVFDARGRITHQNEAALRLLGESGPEIVAHLLAAVSRGEIAALDEIETENGRWVEAAARAVEIGPGSRGAIVVLSEITEHRARQGRLSASLRASDAEIEGLCFSVSHDLRSPLRAIDGFAQLVLTDPSAALNSEHRDALSRVRRAAKRMDVLIDGILGLSRLSRASYEPCDFDLSALVRRTADALLDANPARVIRFLIEPDLMAYGDPRHAALLVEALLGNAVKFSFNRSPATVEFFAEGEGWVVTDDGVGFDMAYAGHLFRPFERLHSPGEFPGNGLGLAAAQRIVRLHGGTISGLGEVGQGARFTFTLASAENGDFDARQASESK